MRTLAPWTLLILAGAVTVVLVRGVLSSSPAPSPASAPSAGVVGRYQAAAVGSRGPQRFGTAFRLDTQTGKAWRAVVRPGWVESWQDIVEPEGDRPNPAQPGRYLLSAELISDRLGQEDAIAVRVDTATGKSWFLRPLPPPASWVAIEETSGSAERGK